MAEEAIYRIGGPLDLTFLMKVSGFEGFDHLRYSKYTPQPVKGMNTEEDIFTQIRRKDILLHHPYQTFTPVIEFVRQAAKDRMFWLSNRHFTASAAIHRSLHRWQQQRRRQAGNGSCGAESPF